MHTQNQVPLHVQHTGSGGGPASKLNVAMKCAMRCGSVVIGIPGHMIYLFAHIGSGPLLTALAMYIFLSIYIAHMWPICGPYVAHVHFSVYFLAHMWPWAHIWALGAVFVYPF